MRTGTGQRLTRLRLLHALALVVAQGGCRSRAGQVTTPPLGHDALTPDGSTVVLAGWTTAGAADPQTAVQTSDGDTSYVSSTTAGSRLAFTFPDTNSAAREVLVILSAARTAGGSGADIDVFAYDGTAWDSLAPAALTVTYANYGWAFNHVYPNAAQRWSAADVDAMTWGLSYVSGNREARVSRVQAIPVTPPPGWAAPDYSWDTHGGISNDAGESMLPVMALDSQGRPTIAWVDNTIPASPYLKSWDGAAWQELGGSATGPGLNTTIWPAITPDLALDAAGNPVVCFQVKENNLVNGYEIYVRRWNGASWEAYGNSASLGGISTNSGASLACAIRIEPSTGFPVVAWHDDASGTSSAYVRRWNGATWAEYGSSATGSGISGGEHAALVDLALNIVEAPVVAWWTQSTDDIKLKVWDALGGVWSEVGGSASPGGISNNSGASTNLALIVDRAGRLLVAWTDSSSGNAEVYLRRWNGTTWEELGGSATSGGISNSGLVQTSYVGRFLAVDGADNPIVAWTQGTGTGSEIFIKQWNGAAWQQMGTGSAMGFGVSARQQSAATPAVAVAPSGEVVVAWSDVNVRTWTGEIYARTFPPAVSGPIVTVAEERAQPPSIEQGAVDQEVGAASIVTDVGSENIDSITVSETSAYAADANLLQVRLHVSNDPVLDAGDIELGAGNFAGESITFSGAPLLVADVTPQYLIVELSAASNAAGTQSGFDLRLNVAGPSQVNGTPLDFSGATRVLLRLGAACGSDSECALGFCADGVCCNSACAQGACDACSQLAGATQDGFCSDLAAGTPCLDGDACNGSESCDGAGACLSGQALNCDDNDVCTDDGCDPGAGCTHVANTAPCEDGDLCTVNDQCAARLCQSGTPLACDDGRACTSDQCNAATGQCEFAVVQNCVCGIDADCDDGRACTGVELCVSSQCVAGTPIACDDADPCTADSCVEPGSCDFTPDPACCANPNACAAVAQAPCEVATCDPVAAQCLVSERSGCCQTTAECPAASPCWSVSCDGGLCAYSPVNGCCTSNADCDDGNSCTSSSCDATTGACALSPIAGCCSTAADCDDGDACTHDQCETAGGCTHRPTGCASGNPCGTDTSCVFASVYIASLPLAQHPTISQAEPNIALRLALQSAALNGSLSGLVVNLDGFDDGGRLPAGVVLRV